MNVTVTFPEELLAELKAEIVTDILGQLADRDSEQWPEYMSAEKAARYLGVSVERVRKLKDRRSLAFHQEAANCRVFFKRNDLDAYMAEQRVEARRRP